MTNIIEIAYELLEYIKNMSVYDIGRFLTESLKIKDFPYNYLFTQNPSLERTIKNVAINIILMEYERNSHSVKIQNFIKENDLQTCMRKFLIDDEFRGNAIRTYYKPNNQSYDVAEVSSKYQVLLRLKKLNNPTY